MYALTDFLDISLMCLAKKNTLAQAPAVLNDKFDKLLTPVLIPAAG